MRQINWNSLRFFKTISNYKEDDFRQRKGGHLNYLWYFTLVEIIIHNLSTPQYGNQSQQVKILAYFMRKEKKVSLWLRVSYFCSFILKLLKVENLNYSNFILSNWRIWKGLTIKQKWGPVMPDICVLDM